MPTHHYSRRSLRYRAAATGAVFAGGLGYIGLADPHRPGFLFPPCPFRLLTGWNCPGCGGLRMTHDLLHANFHAAFVDNAFALIGLPMLAVWILVRRRRGERIFSVPLVIGLVAAVIVWTVVRNVPGFPLVPTFLAE